MTAPGRRTEFIRVRGRVARAYAAGMFEVPRLLADAQSAYGGELGRAFVASLPQRAADFLARWRLRATGPAMSGYCALVLPVVRQDGTPAALKLQLPTDETKGEPLALRVWDGDGAVRLLAHDAESGTMLLEAADAAHDLWSVPSRQAIEVIADLLVRLTAATPPAGLRSLGTVAARALASAGEVADRVADPRQLRLLRSCAAALREVASEQSAMGERLLHWDLHHFNVLGSLRGGADGRRPSSGWLAIDPKPLVGDPGFELYPALFNRFEADEVRWRFDMMTGALGLDRERARAWTLGRALQDGLTVWPGGASLPDDRVCVAETVLAL